MSNTNPSKLPKLSDILAAIRAGETTTAEVAAEYGILGTTLAQSMRLRGWDPATGKALARISAEPGARSIASAMWQERAACVDPTVNAEIFFPKTGHEMEAEQVCGRCPVRIRCLEHALRIEGDLPASCRWGIFGGRGPEDRARIAKGRAA